MNSIEVNQLLDQMRAMTAQAQGVPAETNAVSGGDSFSSMFSNAINTVNDIQKQSGALARGFEQGNPDIALSDVMVASQKSSVAFEATIQVRNRLVEAYQAVMRMPI
ncbi:MAG: flagellar hook-basal body complex protein FliE [Gammaproteobacteria bacterium]|nr:flagellar hook-basal body complex protein FliE [Gammaproteobacteria bacterium]PCH62698.1 MAG: flagellar hook-basal body complex protein FliE [Gammaproteobacteria bacterium]PCH64143.1 MAG: flagellar hook-basal body complex protein FliE [Gammaproteobacteria bacterium]